MLLLSLRRATKGQRISEEYSKWKAATEKGTDFHEKSSYSGCCFFTKNKKQFEVNAVTALT